VVSAPSGVGKTTVCRLVAARDHHLYYSVSATTRPRRRGERNQHDYHFLSEDEFRREIQAGVFLEYAQVFGYFYGTPKRHFERALAAGSDVIMDVDLNGSRAIKRLYPECVTIFLAPPSPKTLPARLRKRGTDSRSEIAKRLAQAQAELAAMNEFSYSVINRKLEVTVEHIRAIITAERLKTGRWL